MSSRGRRELMRRCAQGHPDRPGRYEGTALHRLRASRDAWSRRRQVQALRHLQYVGGTSGREEVEERGGQEWEGRRAVFICSSIPRRLNFTTASTRTPFGRATSTNEQRESSRGERALRWESSSVATVQAVVSSFAARMASISHLHQSYNIPGDRKSVV